MVEMFFITWEFNVQNLTFAQEDMEVFRDGAGVAGTPWMLPGGSDILLEIKHLKP